MADKSENAKKYEERRQARIEMAGQPGAKVLRIQSYDTRLAVNILNQADRQLRFLRDRVFQKGFEAEKVESIFRKWEEITGEMNKFCVEVSKITNIHYFDPTIPANPTKSAEAANPDGGKEKKK
ncbi:MAG: hypothetical protein LBH05_06555 [Deferribacteraceae bacterium]|jgi:hypothetical protein|nr:hypothetical protein [Deferribacteraceae bacterium]